MTCTPGTCFHSKDRATRRYRCVYCGQAPAPRPPRPESSCPTCKGTRVASFVWIGPGADLSYWRPEPCPSCVVAA